MTLTNIIAFFIDSPMFNMHYLAIQKVQMPDGTIRTLLYVFFTGRYFTRRSSWIIFLYRRKIHTITYTWNSSDKEYFAMSELKT